MSVPAKEGAADGRGLSRAPGGASLNTDSLNDLFVCCGSLTSGQLFRVLSRLP